MFQDEPVFIDPPLWGKHFWVSIEGVILAMDPREKHSIDSVYLFLMSLQNTLPCPTCRNHFQNYCLRYNLQKYIYNKEKLFQWIYQLQKEICERNHKTMINYPTYIENVKRRFQLF